MPSKGQGLPSRYGARKVRSAERLRSRAGNYAHPVSSMSVVRPSLFGGLMLAVITRSIFWLTGFTPNRTFWTVAIGVLTVLMLAGVAGLIIYVLRTEPMEIE